MMLRTGLRAALLHSSIMALLAVTLAACGGGGGSIKLPPSPGEQADDHGDGINDASFVRGGGGALGPQSFRATRVYGRIDYGGDTDVFRFEGRPGITYVLRSHAALADVPQPLVLFFNIRITDVDPSNDQTTSSSPTLAEVDGEVPFRIAFTATERRPYYIHISHINEVTGTGNYRWLLTSSEFAQKGPLDNINNLDPRFSGTNLRVAGSRTLDVEIDEMIEQRVIPISPFQSLFQANLLFVDPTLVTNPELRYTHSIPDFILDPLDPEPMPEEKSIHLHFGSPAVGEPTGFFDPNFNKQATADDPHPFFLALDPLENTLELSPNDWALLVGYENYIDVHVNSNFETIPAPLASTPIMSGFDLFESEFRLTGTQAVPPTGLSAFDCTILYLADQQAFQWDFERFDFGGLIADEILLILRNNPPLTIGNLPINIRSGFPGKEGPVVVSLGNVNAPQQDGFIAGDRYPIAAHDRKNIQHVLTDAEWDRLRRFIYDGVEQVITVEDVRGEMREVTYLGWYIEVEDGGTSVIRSDAALHDDEFLMGWEGSIRDPDPVTFPPRSDEPGVVFGSELQEVTFVTDYSEGGLIAVTVNDSFVSHLNSAFTGDVPQCGEGSLGETVRALYKPDTYSYTALAEDGTFWEGTVEVTAGGCVTVALLESEAL